MHNYNVPPHLPSRKLTLPSLGTAGRYSLSERNEESKRPAEVPQIIPFPLWEEIEGGRSFVVNQWAAMAWKAIAQ